MGPNYTHAPVARKPGVSKKIILLIIGGVLAVIAGAAMLLLRGGDTVGTQLSRAVVRQQQLVDLTAKASSNLQSGDIRKINSDAQLFLASDLAELKSLMTSAGVKGVSKEVSQTEVDSTTETKLEEARLINRYDTAYVSVLSQKIDSQQALLNEIHAQIGSVKTKQTLSGVYEKLETIQKQLDAVR